MNNISIVNRTNDDKSNMDDDHTLDNDNKHLKEELDKLKRINNDLTTKLTLTDTKIDRLTEKHKLNIDKCKKEYELITDKNTKLNKELQQTKEKLSETETNLRNTNIQCDLYKSNQDYSRQKNQLYKNEIENLKLLLKQNTNLNQNDLNKRLKEQHDLISMEANELKDKLKLVECELDNLKCENNQLELEKEELLNKNISLEIELNSYKENLNYDKIYVDMQENIRELNKKIIELTFNLNESNLKNELLIKDNEADDKNGLVSRLRHDIEMLKNEKQSIDDSFKILFSDFIDFSDCVKKEFCLNSTNLLLLSPHASLNNKFKLLTNELSTLKNCLVDKYNVDKNNLTCKMNHIGKLELEVNSLRKKLNDIEEKNVKTIEDYKKKLNIIESKNKFLQDRFNKSLIDVTKIKKEKEMPQIKTEAFEIPQVTTTTTTTTINTVLSPSISDSQLINRLQNELQEYKEKYLNAEKEIIKLKNQLNSSNSSIAAGKLAAARRSISTTTSRVSNSSIIRESNLRTRSKTKSDLLNSPIVIPDSTEKTNTTTTTSILKKMMNDTDLQINTRKMSYKSKSKSLANLNILRCDDQMETMNTSNNLISTNSFTNGHGTKKRSREDGDFIESYPKSQRLQCDTTTLSPQLNTHNNIQSNQIQQTSQNNTNKIHNELTNLEIKKENFNLSLEEKKKHKCNLCSFSTTKPWYLVLHMKKHTNKKQTQ